MFNLNIDTYGSIYIHIYTTQKNIYINYISIKPKPQCWGYVKETQESIERTPNDQSGNNLSKK